MIQDGRRANRLLGEKSPYLRQHAYNPVDWYPWGEEAFAKARAENKPIFLSIGYSTCHWCHRMERESFSNPEVAALLNQDFVCIKVDREERPDVDRVYMTFVQALNGEGGWPLSVWLTPELKPFFGGTYYPLENHGGRPGFKSLLSRLSSAWGSQREQLETRSAQMLAALAADARTPLGEGAVPIAEWREKALVEARGMFDSVNGGFEQAPKFPAGSMLDFLLDVHATSPDEKQREEALAMALQTLRSMAEGGLHDHVGGGFHRYSVDAEWKVPHFEKMLYDQAQLSNAYVTAYQITGDVAHAEVARNLLAFVETRLTGADGGFLSALDADSPLPGRPDGHAEGAYYVWTEGELAELLGEDAPLFSFAYAVEPAGNAADELAGYNVLRRAQNDAACAARFHLGKDEVARKLTSARQLLAAARMKRIGPLCDDKVITAWNGLMISAFARAAQALQEPRYATLATRAAQFVRSRLYEPSTGELARSYRDGKRDALGFAEDYACMVQACLDLYEATFDVAWLRWALELQEKQIALFHDPEGGGFFASAKGDLSVVLRLKEDTDGAEPSANSVSVRNLVRLASLLHREEWNTLALQTARAFTSQFEHAPAAMPVMLSALGWLDGSAQQVVLLGEASEATTQLAREVWTRHLPRRVMMRVDTTSRAFFSERVAFISELPEAPAETATAYLCRNFACQLPTRDPAVLARQLDDSR